MPSMWSNVILDASVKYFCSSGLFCIKQVALYSVDWASSNQLKT